MYNENYVLDMYIYYIYLNDGNGPELSFLNTFAVALTSYTRILLMKVKQVADENGTWHCVYRYTTCKQKAMEVQEIRHAKGDAEQKRSPANKNANDANDFKMMKLCFNNDNNTGYLNGCNCKEFEVNLDCLICPSDMRRKHEIEAHVSSVQKDCMNLRN